MPKRNTNSALGLAAAALPSGTLLHAAKPIETAPVLAKLSTKQIAKAKLGLVSALPKGVSQAKVQEAQAMSVHGEVALLPVSYASPVPDAIIAGATRDRCGVYLVNQDGTAAFLPTLGVGNTETVECRDLAAIGAATQAA